MLTSLPLLLLPLLLVHHAHAQEVAITQLTPPQQPIATVPPSTLDAKLLASNVGIPADCGPEDKRCLVDQRSFEVMTRLHALLDDDKNGAVDAAEVDDFAREELNYAADFERTEALNRGDPSVSTRELWHIWRISEPYNWTVDDVCRWADLHVGLPQLASGLREFAIDGAHLPLLTEPAHHPTAAQAVRGLTQTQRRKLAIKAIDVVLFGPPKKAHSALKDALLALFLLITTGGVWLGLVQRRFFEDHRLKMCHQLAHLRNAEDSLADLQQKLSSAERQSEKVSMEKLHLEELYKKEICNLKERANQLSQERRQRRSETPSAGGQAVEDSEDPGCLRDQLAQAEREIVQLRGLVEESARIQLRASSGMPPEGSSAAVELQHLMQTCYETELRYCGANKTIAEEQLRKASEGLERLKRRQYSVVGLFRNAFNSAELVDFIEQDIAKAKEFADKVKLDIQERMQRWSRIEQIMGVSIVSKPEHCGDLNIRPYANRWLLKTAAKFRRSATQIFSDHQLCLTPVHELVSSSGGNSNSNAATGVGVDTTDQATNVLHVGGPLRLFVKPDSRQLFRRESYTSGSGAASNAADNLDSSNQPQAANSTTAVVATTISRASSSASSAAVSFCLPQDLASSPPPRMGTHCPSGRHPLAGKKIPPSTLHHHHQLQQQQQLQQQPIIDLHQLQQLATPQNADGILDEVSETEPDQLVFESGAGGTGASSPSEEGACRSPSFVGTVSCASLKSQASASLASQASCSAVSVGGGKKASKSGNSFFKRRFNLFGKRKQ